MHLTSRRTATPPLQATPITRAVSGQRRTATAGPQFERASGRCSQPSSLSEGHALAARQLVPAGGELHPALRLAIGAARDNLLPSVHAPLRASSGASIGFSRTGPCVATNWAISNGAADALDLDCCCICLESLQNREKLALFPCAHRTHAACAKRWLQAAANPSCPTCRQQVPVGRQLLDRHKEVQRPPHASWPCSAMPAAVARAPQRLPLPAADFAEAEAWLARGLAPSAATGEVMATCRCSRELAEAALREATASGLDGSEAAARAKRMAAARLEAGGRELLSALEAEDAPAAARMLAAGAAGTDLGLRRAWGAGVAGQTALMLAVHHRNYHLVQRMCEAIASATAGPDADLDARDGRGLTALALASSCGFPELCALLLAFGADASGGSSAGGQSTPLELAADDDVRRVLLGSTASGASAGFAARGVGGGRCGSGSGSTAAAVAALRRSFSCA